MSHLVAVTTRVGHPDASHLARSFIEDGYIRYLASAGLAPVGLSAALDPPAIRRILRSVSGLVLTGGDDVSPDRYGASPDPATLPVPTRDAVEWEALEAADLRTLPVLGICRGAQVLNVFRGGTLHQHLPDLAWVSERHGVDVFPGGEDAHAVQAVPGSRMAHALGSSVVRVNSYHHQAIDALGRDLVVTARAEDGTIEAVEDPRPDRWVVGVQWHPERAVSGSTRPGAARLLKAFAQAVRRKG